MKITILAIITALFITSCTNKNEQVTFTGQIINPTKDMVWITINDSLLSTKLDENNKFSFKLDITEANSYRVDHGGWTLVFLKPGSNLNLTLDTEDFDNSITYSGTDLEENKYLKERLLIKEFLEDNRHEIPNLSKSEFEGIIKNTLGTWKKLLLRLENIESAEYAKFKKMELEKQSKLKTLITDYYMGMINITPGNTAIDFNVFDINGKEYSLKGFKNKVICIDVWASWCSACLKEMPIFEELANKYKDQEIVFMGISVEDKEEIWKKLLKEKEIKGIQFWAKKGRKSDFFKNYKLYDLPAYIIIDKNGKIFKSRAPKPSENLEKIIIEALKN